jgi:diaminohydroxyphosphoribosylaminopyrimidine deaminase / 5-amino-6-(5-phosphoribosylamino)uracil reductase
METPAGYMRQALRLAEKGRGRVSPNPVVGAVIVRAGRVIGTGAHLCLGGPHAEVHALREAGEQARGATLYVTLEPCCVQGRTPPCTEALIAAGIGAVECALLDPDARVNGSGLRQLEQAGVQVGVGLETAAAQRQNAGYLKHRRCGLPWVTLKLAQSVDGRIATASGDARWISGERSRRWVHRTRSRVDAVMVGANTVLADDPQLTVRHVKGHSPRPLVVDGRLRVPPVARALQRPGAVVLTSDDSPAAARTAMERQGVEVWTFGGVGGRIDLRAAMRRAAAAGITSVLLEGGGDLAAQALTAQVVDEVQIYIAPLLLGTGVSSIGDLGAVRVGDAVKLAEVRVRRLGPDLLYSAMVQDSCSQA